MIITSIRIEIGLELPIGCKTTPADELDGSHLIFEKKSIQKRKFLPYFDIGDCGFDNIDNFKKIRETGIHSYH